jgi:hypothetical protein
MFQLGSIQVLAVVLWMFIYFIHFDLPTRRIYGWQMWICTSSLPSIYCKMPC